MCGVFAVGLHISLIYILNSMGLVLSSFDRNTNTFSRSETTNRQPPNRTAQTRFRFGRRLASI